MISHVVIPFEDLKNRVEAEVRAEADRLLQEVIAPMIETDRCLLCEGGRTFVYFEGNMLVFARVKEILEKAGYKAEYGEEEDDSDPDLPGVYHLIWISGATK